MQQLLKAEQFFKNNIQHQVEQYISKSEQVAKEYLQKKQQADKKSLKNTQILDELKRQLQILNQIKLSGLELPGNSNQQIKALILKYQCIIDRYENYSDISTDNVKDQNLEKNQQQSQQNLSFMIDEQQPIFYQYDQFNDDAINKSSTVLKKIKIFGLKSLQFLAVILLLISVFQFIII